MRYRFRKDEDHQAGAKMNLEFLAGFAKRSSRPTDAQSIATEIFERLTYRIGKDPIVAKPHDWLGATILFIRDRAIDHWMDSTREAYRNERKRVYYLSLEFLIGRLMRDTLNNLEMLGPVTDGLELLGVDVDAIAALEPDAALGNGGLGRLAACFMESMASVGIPAYGYGIRYVNGMFRQQINDGWQIELPETWLNHGNPWEFQRREAAYEIGFGGNVETTSDAAGGATLTWKPVERMMAEAIDTPVVGWRGKRVNTLRLWNAQAIDAIMLDAFNAGDHLGALRESTRASSITRVLYPADSNAAGQELRLRQEYFFSSASLQDIVRRHVQQYRDLRLLPEKAAIQLNDTHPAISVAELVRLLIDQHGLRFDAAWDITQRTIGYTNHTLLPEALESWPVPLMERLLPRHMQIIYAINAKILKEARSGGFSDETVRSISLVDENGERRVRMGNLAFVGSHSINGVSELHTELMKKTVFADLNRVFPGRINNKTNGITPRRWLMEANPELFALIRETVGDQVLEDISAIEGIDKLAKDSGFAAKFATIKRHNKQRLAELIHRTVGVRTDPSAMFDIHIKRIHEYKRQLLNIIETVALYDQMRSHPDKDWTPRVKIFAGKAAPSYHNAKLIIKLANDVARVVNSDPSVGDLLKVVFLPNYNVSLAEVLMPAADLSEQISTAGMEASGTGNMKLGLNGAITIGTLDGANVEMREKVGEENMLIFGLTAAEVAQRRASGYDPRATIAASPELSQAISAISSGVFSHDQPDRYRDLISGIENGDWFMVAADFDEYAAAQRKADQLWTNKAAWNACAIHNVARLHWFSSDRTIREYARDIWDVVPGAV